MYSVKVATLITLLCSTSGCVGIAVETQTSRESEPLSGYYANGSWHSWREVEHPENGRVTLDAEQRWCGVTLWAIEPIPLILPVCRGYTQVVFENGVPTKQIEGLTRGFFLGCGPGVFLATQIANGETSFCAASN